MKYKTIGVLLSAAILLSLIEARAQEPRSMPVADRVGHHSCLVSSLSDLTRSDLKNLDSFHVVPDPSDEGSAHNLIADALLQFGFSVSVGDLEDAPDGAKVLVHSRSDWVWDFSTYLRALIIMFRAPTTNELIGVANFNTFDHNTEHVPVYVKQTVEDLLLLLNEPEGAPPC